MTTFYFFNWSTGKVRKVYCDDIKDSWNTLRAVYGSKADDYEGPFTSMAKVNDWIIRMKKLAAEW